MLRKSTPALIIVPAKGDSIRLARKNLRELDGVPLFARTVYQALSALDDDDGLSRIVVSSDDDEVASICRARFDTSDASTRVDLWPEPRRHFDLRLLRDEILREYAAYHRMFRCVMMLLPTFPFRSADDIRAPLDLIEQGHESVQSATYLERHRIYVPNSYVAVDALGAGNRIPLKRPQFKTYLEIDARRATDVDTMDDWHTAERLLPLFDFELGSWRDQ